MGSGGGENVGNVGPMVAKYRWGDNSWLVITLFDPIDVPSNQSWDCSEQEVFRSGLGAAQPTGVCSLTMLADWLTGL